MTTLLSTSILAAASYNARAPADHAGWDVLYVAAGMIAIVLTVALAATMANHRSDRRKTR